MLRYRISYTRLQALTICVKTVRRTRGIIILLLKQDVYLRIRDHSLLTTAVIQFIGCTCINIPVTRHMETSLQFITLIPRDIPSGSPYCWVSKAVCMPASLGVGVIARWTPDQHMAPDVTTASDLLSIKCSLPACVWEWWWPLNRNVTLVANVLSQAQFNYFNPTWG